MKPSRTLRLLLLVAVVAGLAALPPGAVALPPALTTPGSMTVEATSAGGAAVPYAVTADDARATVSCAPASGSVFGIGTTTVVCTARGTTGEVSRASFSVTVQDTTAPAFSRVPAPIVRNVNGVASAKVAYSAPVARDLVDGAVASDCTPASGGVFPLGTTTVTCTAVDSRGNGAATTFDVSLIDKVAPPDVTNVVVRGGDNFVQLSWQLPTSPDIAGVVVIRDPGGSIVFQGRATSFVDRDVKPKGHYQYVVASYDWARNPAKGVTVFAAAQVSNLLAPQDGAILAAPPLLEWKPVKHADYYNVQLWAVLPSGAVKVFSTWPTASRLQLNASWTFAGKKHLLSAGRYRWYVWPGVGRIQDARYGSLIGAGSFAVS